MGTFSIWHWLIVLIVFVGPVIPIALANKDKTLARLPYFYRILALVAVGLLLGILSEWSDNLGVVLIVLIVCLVLAMWVLEYLWSVHRAQDIGWSKWWTLLFVLPGINLIYLLVILFRPSRKVEEQQEATS